MKIIAIGDIHGRDMWKKVIDQNPDYDKVIFIGDYFDTPEKRFNQAWQLDNFDEILWFKKHNPLTCTLLLGNHDYHYLPTVHQRYGGFQDLLKVTVGPKIQKAIDDKQIQMCYKHEQYLFTHAGVTQQFLQYEKDLYGEVDRALNDLLLIAPQIFQHTSEDPTRFGDHPSQSPIRVRPNALLSSLLPGYVQVVGHTRMESIIIRDDIILIDALGAPKEFLIIEDGVPRVGYVK